MTDRWVISDPHFGHAAMFEKFKRPCPMCDCGAVDHPSPRHTVLPTECGHCAGTGEVPLRPFTSVEEMDETIVERWNALVRPKDRVYLLGDICMRRAALGIVRRLNGRICHVGGNHDLFRAKDYLAVGIEDVRGVKVHDNVLMTHVPVHPGSRARFALNVHGHTHASVVTMENATGDEVPDPWYVNVCVEQTDYRPVPWEEIQRLKEARRCAI